MTVFPLSRALRAPLAVTTVLALTVAGVYAFPDAAFAASTATINGATTYQTINGFGASEAFGEAQTVMNASSSVQTQTLNDLYSPTAGAGLTILRNEIPSEAGETIEPNAPSSPTATPSYGALGNDDGQEWFSKQVQSNYGVNQIFADAWSAPAFMKTNDSVDNGGTVCGTPSAACSSGDWRQAYANYLIQYAKDYAADGINLDYIGFENEANLSTSYASMQMSPAQTANFADVVGPTLASSGLSTKLECCAAEGWNYAAQYTSAITSDPVANSYVKLMTSHGYTQAPTSALATSGQPTWETEWSTFDSFDPAWDDNTDASGFTWAKSIYTGLTSANLSAFLYWWGSTTPSENGDNEGLLEINGSTVTTTGRLWAFADYSRYIHPGAVRIGATTSDGNVDLSAFKNTDGTIAIVALNSNTAADTLSYSLPGTGITNGAAAPFLTNSSNDAAAQATIPVAGGAFTATIPARSLETFVLTGSGATSSPTASPTTSASASPTTSASATASASASATASPTGSPTSTPGAACTVTYTTTSQWVGGFTSNVTIKAGSQAIDPWDLTFTFPGDQKITDAWNAQLSQSGEGVSLTNESYNADISPGGNTSLGFQGTWTNSDAAPTSFAVNGVACAT
jgi:O-glycosyl hydrolase